MSYLAFGGSAVLAGFAVPSFGLRETATVYGAIVIALSLVAAAAGASDCASAASRSAAGGLAAAGAGKHEPRMPAGVR